jgi:abortive infection alpha-like protein
MGTPDQGLELAKEAVKDLLAPVTDVVKQLLGPAATEIGLSLGESVRVWRLKRTVRLLEEVRQIAVDAGLDLKPVAPRLLFPLLEAASLEDNKDLHERWVALLTNAATTDYDTEILPCFPDILRQLTAEEAQFLDRAYEQVTTDAEKRQAEIRERNPNAPEDAGTAAISGQLLKSVHPIMVENLERLMLVTRVTVPLSLDDSLTNTFPPANRLYVTELAKSFVRACHLPQRASTQ